MPLDAVQLLWLNLVTNGVQDVAVLSPMTEEIFAFLANIGIICFLFRIGLESNLRGFMAQLRRTGLIWICNVGVSGLLGYLTCAYVLNLPSIPGLMVAVAFTAASVGIPVAIWQEVGVMHTETDDLLLSTLCAKVHTA